MYNFLIIMIRVTMADVVSPSHNDIATVSISAIPDSLMRLSFSPSVLRWVFSGHLDVNILYFYFFAFDYLEHDLQW